MGAVLRVIIQGDDKASRPIKNVRDAAQRLGDTARGTVTRGLEPLKNLLGVGLKTAVLGVVAALVGLAAGIGSSVNAAADMEQQVANIAATMGLMGDQVEVVEDLIRDLGLDPKLKVSAVEAANAIEMLGKNGLSLSDILDGAARNTVLLANSTGADFASAADVATDVMSLFGIEAKNMQEAVNGITSVTTNSKFGFEDYRFALAAAGGAAKVAGVDFGDFNATIAAIAPSFSSGSDAGTSFKVFLQRLVPASGPAEDAMKALGLITKDGANAFFTATGEMKGMGEIAGILAQATGNLSEEQKLQALSTIFGTDALRAAAAIADVGQEKFAELKATMGNTNAEEAAATRMNTFRGALEVAQGVVETLGIQIGQAFLPVVRTLVERFTELADRHGPAVVVFFGQLAAQLVPLIGFVEAVVTQGTLFNNKLTELSPGLQAVVQGVGDLWKWLSDLLRPVTDLIAKYVTWKDVFLVFTGVVLSVVIPAIVSFVTAAAPVVALIGALIAVTATLRNAWENDWGGIQGKTQAVVDFIRNAIETIKGFFSGLRNAMTIFSGDWRDTLQEVFTSGDLGQKAKEMGMTIMNRIREGIAQITPENVAQATRSVIEIHEGMIRKAGEFHTKIFNIGMDLLRWMVEGKDSIQDQTLSQFAGVADKMLVRLVEKLRRSIYFQLGASVMTWIRDGINHHFGDVVNRAGDVARDLLGRLQGGITRDTIFWTGANVTGWLRDGINHHFWDAVTRAGDIGREIINRLRNALSVDVFREFGRNISKGIAEGIDQLRGEINRVIDNLTALIPQWIKDQLGIGSPSKVTMALGRDTMEGFRIGLEQLSLDELIGDTALGEFAGAAQTGSSVTNNSSVSNVFNVSGSPAGRNGDLFGQVRTLNAIYGA